MFGPIPAKKFTAPQTHAAGCGGTGHGSCVPWQTTAQATQTLQLPRSGFGLGVRCFCSRFLELLLCFGEGNLSLSWVCCSKGGEAGWELLGLLGEDEPNKRLCSNDVSFRLSRELACSESPNSLWLLPWGPCGAHGGGRAVLPLAGADGEGCWRARSPTDASWAVPPCARVHFTPGGWKRFGEISLPHYPW